MLNRKFNKAQRNSRSTVISKSAESNFRRSAVARAINQNLSLSKLCALTALTISSPAFAQSFPATINLSELDGSDGFSIAGVGNGTNVGFSVSTAGDFNGDGITDVIIGAPSSNANQLYGSDYTGAAYIVFGGEDVGIRGTLDLTNLNGDDGFLISGNSERGMFGYSVSDAGDFNGDGVTDLIIGAPGNTTSFVVFGGADLDGAGVLPLATILDGANGLEITGDQVPSVFGRTDQSGESVSGAGDFNGDGISDVIVGASEASSEFANGEGGFEGESYIVFGGTDAGNSNPLELETLDGSNGFVIKGIDDSDFSGSEVSDAGDFNGDGVPDVIIGAPFADGNGSGNAGESYIVFGGADVGSSGSLELSSLDGANGFVINGIDDYDFSGAVSTAADFNGDGVSDVIIGAFAAGETYIVFGGTGTGNSGSLELSSLDGTNGFVINGVNEFGFLGRSVHAAGDVNGDGVEDVIIEASFAGPIGEGESYVVFGGPAVGSGGVLELSTLDGTNGFTIAGSGSRVSAAGDINNDGVSDVIVAGSGQTSDGLDLLSFVVFGRETTTPPTPPATLTCNGLPVTVNLALGQLPTSGADVIQGTEGDDTIRALGGNDTICGLGGDDIINAGGGDDFVDAGAGNDRVFGLFGADILRGRSGKDRIFGGNGEDLINGDGGADRLDGGAGADLIFGGGGADELFGRDGNDTLFGGPGNDSIVGGNGEDEINGGAGNNSCVSDGADNISECQ